MWRAIRVGLLLFLLCAVATQAWLDRHRTTSWERTVWVGAFPLNGDSSAAAAEELRAMSDADFAPIATYLQSEAHRYGVGVDQPLQIRLYPSPDKAPPLPTPNASALARLGWSLKLRWYRWRTLHALARSEPQIVLFLLYYDPRTHDLLPHSTGLQRGLTGLVHLYAGPEQRGENAVVTAHELLHTFGATDKYDLNSNVPRYPEGFADPQRQPRYPQVKAEIMAGRIPLSATEQVMAADLDETVVGAKTAREIGWSAR